MDGGDTDRGIESLVDASVRWFAARLRFANRFVQPRARGSDENDFRLEAAMKIACWLRFRKDRQAHIGRVGNGRQTSSVKRQDMTHDV